MEALIQAYSKQICPLLSHRVSADGKANFIEVTSDTENCYMCSFKGLDVFNIKVEKLVEEIDKISPYDRELWEDENAIHSNSNINWFKEPKEQGMHLRLPVAMVSM